MKTVKKKLSIILAVTMMLTFIAGMPLAAAAAGTETAPIVIDLETVNENGHGYEC